MKDRYVIDTNVLIAASAAMAMRSGKPLLPHHQEVTPQDAGQLEKVLDWLIAFAQSDSRLVLDNAGQINVEYHRKLDFYDYGIQVVMLKLSRDQIDRVNVDYDADGNGAGAGAGLGAGAGTTERDQAEFNKLKARRLYDIANVRADLVGHVCAQLGA